jgi:hypothetical protein
MIARVKGMAVTQHRENLSWQGKNDAKSGVGEPAF